MSDTYHIMYVNDPSTIARHYLPNPVTEESLRWLVDQAADGGADSFVQDVYSQGFTVYFRSPRFQFDPRIQHEAFLPLLDAGIQPIQVELDRCRERGMPFLAGFRMNDSHPIGPPPSFPFRADFIQSHPEYVLKDPRPEPGWHAGDPLDFSFDEVRDFKFAVMKEVATTVDVDGIELCYRNPGYFPFGQGRERAHLMTDLLRRVRAMLDEHGRAQGRKPMLGVRVFSTIEECLDMGLDVPAWTAENLLDYLCPEDAFYTDYNAPYAEFAPLVQGTACKFYPGALPIISMRRRYEVSKKITAPSKYRLGKQGMTVANYRALARTFYASGADGISFFNHLNPENFHVFGEVDDPRKVARGERHYVFDPTWEILHREPSFGQDRTISGALKGHRVFLDRSADRPSGVFPLQMYEDGDGLRAVSLVLGGKLTDEDELDVRLNDVPLAPGGEPWPGDEPGCTTEHLQSTRSFAVSPDALVSGVNQLSIMLTKPDPGTTGMIVIDEVQVWIQART